MDVSLTPKLEDFVRRKVASGHYSNASEVIHEALRLLVERDTAAVREHTAASPDKEAVRAQLADLKTALRDRGVTSVALRSCAATPAPTAK